MAVAEPAESAATEGGDQRQPAPRRQRDQQEERREDHGDDRQDRLDLGDSTARGEIGAVTTRSCASSPEMASQERPPASWPAAMTSTGTTTTSTPLGRAVVDPEQQCGRQEVEDLHQRLRQQPGVARQEPPFLDAQRLPGGGPPEAVAAPACRTAPRDRPTAAMAWLREAGGGEGNGGSQHAKGRQDHGRRGQRGRPSRRGREARTGSRHRVPRRRVRPIAAPRSGHVAIGRGWRRPGCRRRSRRRPRPRRSGRSAASASARRRGRGRWSPARRWRWQGRPARRGRRRQRAIAARRRAPARRSAGWRAGRPAPWW